MAASTGQTASLLALYEKARSFHGESRWWPGASPFEIAVGSILTQNTNWDNVERAMDNIRRAGALSEAALSAKTVDELAELVRPAGSFRVKARRLKNFLDFLNNAGGGLMRGLARMDPAELRPRLLEVKGIGPETCDKILLYALGHPVFVVDAFTARVLSRHGYAPREACYDELQELFSGLPEDPALFADFHAQFVRMGQDFCRPKKPRCTECPWCYDLNR